ncbi:MAG: hypothetical protein Q9169_004519 [Polycauliona sp. 2 TL-2023]
MCLTKFATSNVQSAERVANLANQLKRLHYQDAHLVSPPRLSARREAESLHVRYIPYIMNLQARFEPYIYARICGVIERALDGADSHKLAITRRALGQMMGLSDEPTHDLWEDMLEIVFPVWLENKEISEEKATQKWYKSVETRLTNEAREKQRLASGFFSAPPKQ